MNSKMLYTNINIIIKEACMAEIYGVHDEHINPCMNHLVIVIITLQNHLHMMLSKHCNSVKVFCHPEKLFIQLESSTMSPVWPLSYAGWPAEEADRRRQKITNSDTQKEPAFSPHLFLWLPAAWKAPTSIKSFWCWAGSCSEENHAHLLNSSPLCKLAVFSAIQAQIPAALLHFSHLLPSTAAFAFCGWHFLHF